MRSQFNSFRTTHESNSMPVDIKINSMANTFGIGKSEMERIAIHTKQSRLIPFDTCMKCEA